VDITKDAMAIRLAYDATLPILEAFAVDITKHTMAIRLAYDATLPI